MASIEEYTSRLAALLNEMEPGSGVWISGDITVHYWADDMSAIKTAVLSCMDIGDGEFEWKVK